MTDYRTDIYDLLDLSVNDTDLSATLSIPENLVYFDGHFDELAVLPGVVQVHWAIEMARKYLPVTGDFTSIDVLKFMRVIRPEDIVTLNITNHPQKNTIDFSYSTGETIHSKGKVGFSS